LSIRAIRLRYLLPGIIFPISLALWIDYNLSPRVSDDSPVCWYWYGSLLSACLNFPAYMYSSFAEPLWHLSFRLGRLWIAPRTVLFFAIVIVFWYWIGKTIERALRIQPAIVRRPQGWWLALLAFAAAWGILIAIAVSFEAVSLLWTFNWFYLRYIATDLELMKAAQVIWGIFLASYYSRRFVADLRARRVVWKAPSVT
jgi:hypothetical protein